MNEWLLILTILFSSGRNIFSKRTTNSRGKKEFYFSQMLLFAVGGLTVFLFSPKKAVLLSLTVIPYSVIYGILLCSAQGFYTAALKEGNTSICSLIYSFGFLIPTVFGALFYNEGFGIMQCVGLILAIITLVLTTNTEKQEGVGNRYFFPLAVAALSSGGLGVMQKLQSKAISDDMIHSFLFFAFVVSFLLSLVGFLLQKGTYTLPKHNLVNSCTVGVCFGGANYLNTVLAGKMKSSVFFPTQNIGTLLLTVILSVLIFKEKISLRKAAGLILGILTIIVLKIKI